LPVWRAWMRFREATRGGRIEAAPACATRPAQCILKLASKAPTRVRAPDCTLLSRVASVAHPGY
jgi:hypothetical protein